MSTVVTETAPDVEVIAPPAAPARTIAPPVNVWVSLARMVPPAPSVMVSVVAHCNPRVDIVNVCDAPPVELNDTLANSASPRFAPAKVIVPPVAESKVTVAVPALQPTASVDALDQVPLTIQDSDPNEIAEAALLISTLPVMTTEPDVLVRSPPDIVTFPLTVNVWVLFASVPPEMVNPVAVS